MGTQNPFQSPQAESEPDFSYPRTEPDRNLVWLLFSFRGRIPRGVFWGASILITFVFFFLAAIISTLATSSGSEAEDFVQFSILPLYAVHVWMSLAIQAKRWHDRNKSGWCTLICLIPIVGGIIVLVETGFLRGTQGRNRYGDDPRPEARLRNLARLRHEQFVLGEVVEMDGTDATDEDLAGLAGNSQIKELRLGGTLITDAGLEHCRGLASLEALDLSMTGITDRGLDALTGLRNLTTLWLGGTRVSDAGLPRLTVLERLTDVYAANTDVTAAGAERFRDVRPGCTVHV